MIVSESRRVLFVHVQKTGGSSIDQVLLDRLPDARPVLGLRGDRHATWRVAVAARPEYADYFTFGFVRNPWARLASWYSMIQRVGRTAERRQVAIGNRFWAQAWADYPDFESFVVAGSERFVRLRRPQIDYLRLPGPAGRTADFVGRTETLAADLATLGERLGVDLTTELPHVNRSQRKRATRPDGYRALYTPEMRDLVARHFALDLELFGYHF